MLTDERKNIINGLVRTEKGWVSIEQKVKSEALRKKKIEKGLVVFEGEWISIEEKITRVSRNLMSPPQITNRTINQQTYNIYNDNRTVQENIHEHRHVHLDPGQSGRVTGSELQGPAEGEITTPS